MTKSEQLARLTNRATRYELALINGDTRILVMYSHGRARHDLLKCCRTHGEAIVALACPTGEELLTFAPKAADGAKIGPWSIRFTGRTQREAIIEGELPFIGDVGRVARVFEVSAETAATALEVAK